MESVKDLLKFRIGYHPRANNSILHYSPRTSISKNTVSFNDYTAICVHLKIPINSYMYICNEYTYTCVVHNYKGVSLPCLSKSASTQTLNIPLLFDCDANSQTFE